MDIKAVIKSIPLVGPFARRARAAFSRRGRIGYGIATLRKLGGVHPRTCTLCGYSGLFRAFGDPPRWDARCPNCGSLERHRLLALCLTERPKLIHGRVVHFAPEPAVAKFIAPMPDQYQSADYLRKDCDLRLNLEELSLADSSVDVFIVSHVLEHVNDRLALAELYRCLRPGGLTIIMVPIVEAWKSSYENDQVTSESDRNLHFGQWDHIRYYGSDLRQRITDAGFELEEFTGTPADCIKHGLMRGETVFLAWKR